jgi:hypothetical protein
MERKANISHLIAAFNALSSVQDRNFKCSTDFGEPFKITEDGRCRTICNAAGWVVQYPYFRKLGLSMDKPGGNGIGARYAPTFRATEGRVRLLRGYGAVAHVLGMDTDAAMHIFAPYYYAAPEATTLRDVLRRLKTFITKAGGKAELDAALAESKAPKAVRKARTTKTIRTRVVAPERFSASIVEIEVPQ